MRHHPDTDRLARALEKCLPKAVAWNGELFRSASPKYANKDDFITGAGSKAAGARWNPPGGVHILVPSAALKGGSNLLVFPANLDPAEELAPHRGPEQSSAEALSSRSTCKSAGFFACLFSSCGR